MLYAVIDDRETGKTQLAIDIWLADPMNTTLIVDGMHRRADAIKRMGDKFPEQFINGIKPYNKNLFVGSGSVAKKIVWDEPFMKKEWKAFLKSLQVASVSGVEVIIIGTFRNEIRDRMALAKLKPHYTTVKEFRQNHFWESEVMKGFEQFYDEQE